MNRIIIKTFDYFKEHGCKVSINKAKRKLTIEKIGTEEITLSTSLAKTLGFDSSIDITGIHLLAFIAQTLYLN